jgi:hypothetical protein
LIRGHLDGGTAAVAHAFWITIRVSIQGVTGIRIPSDPIDFLIDTGSPWTMLHPMDASNYAGIKLPRLQNMRAQGWSDLVDRGGLGGHGALFAVKPCRYTFLQEDGTELHIAGTIHIGESTAVSNTHPSLLGRDVLQHFTLSVTPGRDEVLLDYVS